MLDLNLPSVILREAWSITRLDVIRQTVSRTIVDLGRLADEEDQTQRSSGADPAERGARRMALHMCILELMNEAGLDTSALAVPLDGAPDDVDYGKRYDQAIDHYRSVAAASLVTALGVVRPEVESEQ